MSLITVPEIIARVEGRVGRLTLNRPKALHALTTPMCLAISSALLAWRDDPAIDLVLIDHAGERGFCAGGDIRMMAEAGLNDPDAGAAFFLAEYRMNALLQAYPKPVVAVMDGVTMGGGVGLSVYARYRIATERTLFAMPETGIGLFPDVGTGWVLSRLPGEIGTWMALTGARLKAADCVYLNLCTHSIESAGIEAVKQRLVAAPEGAAKILARFSMDPGPAPLAGKQKALDGYFEHGSVEEIVAALKAGSSWAQDQAEVLASKSPTSMKVALRELRAARENPSFADEIALEYRLACRIICTPDFQEGVRAVVIDKDNAPRWSPARLEEVTDEMLDALFAPFEQREEWSPLP
ncbi:MAG: enoyl-CoA hydratase/isomerase family protein [Caulobacteraceae bacterium]